MPVSAPRFSIPVFWNLWGHSYFQHGFGPRNQSGRIDAFFRALVPVGYGDFANWAVTGARLAVEGNSQGGYARVLNNVLQVVGSTGPSGPAVNLGGAHLNCWGINDLGFETNTAQYNAAYAIAARVVISRQRMSWLRLNNYAGSAGTGVLTYGTGFTNVATGGEFSSGLTLRTCTTTGANATVTFTLPSDYNGETIASLWIANPGVAGGTITKSGTAGVTGTFSTSNIMVAGSINHSPVVDRIKGLTAANAGQTIIYTVTAIDASANVLFDSVWGESLSPQPVLWCNTPRCTAAGYATYPTPPTDADVAAFNAVIPPVIAEFDQMVQLVDLDGALQKDPTALIFDGLHPNELGASLCADAIMTALRKCDTGTSRYGLTANLQSNSPRYGQDIFPHRTGFWHTVMCGGPSATTYTPVAADLWAIPFLVTTGIRRVTNWSVDLSATSTAGTTVWFALYDDRAYSGYPQVKYLDTTPSTAVTLPATATVFNSAGSGSGSISQPLDPGLYWMVLQIAAINAPGALRTIKGPTQYMPNLATGGGQFAATSSPAAWKLTSQPAGPLPKLFPAGGVLTDNVPLIGLKLI